MDGVNNEYINDALKILLRSVGIKEAVDEKPLVSLIQGKKIKDAIQDIGRHLGLPVQVNLTYVPMDYDPRVQGYFHSTHIVKTDESGRGVGGIVAQVSIPSNLPAYGSPDLIDFPISVRVSENCTENPTVLIMTMAHELSHIVLYSMRHPEKDNEFYTDLTAMMLGFGHIMKTGRMQRTSISKYVGSHLQTTTTVTTYGYLSDDNFHFAFDKIARLADRFRGIKQDILKINGLLLAQAKSQEMRLLHIRRYLAYIGKKPPRRIQAADAEFIGRLYNTNFVHEFATKLDSISRECLEMKSSCTMVSHYRKAEITYLRQAEKRTDELLVDMRNLRKLIGETLSTLGKYVSQLAKFKTTWQVKGSAST